MRSTVTLSLVLAIAAASVIPESPERIVGGSVTTIDRYPTIVSVLYSFDGAIFTQICGGTVINNRSILTAAHCTTETANRIRARVGSTWSNSGGVVHSASTLINHPNYNMVLFDSDISIIRTATNIVFVDNTVQPGFFAGANYNVVDDSLVWAAGWGITELGSSSEQLRHVQLSTLNQGVCQQRYNAIRITDNMLCVHWAQGGRDQCSQDSGGPLYHNGVVVGVCSFGSVPCGNPNVPGVNVRVSRFIDWIQANA